jgi:hypothetical protein
MTLAAVVGLDLVVVLLILVGIAVPLWAVVDAARRPADAFSAARSNKTIWIVVIAVAWFFGLGFFLGGFYLLFTRPKVRRRMEGLR